ncbi:pseudoazurin [uncultured Marivita sp.]|uniref:pseudoazurin n=1 Tax=uncultured Marivita sp. TaxID=888080 RepID=UPI0026367516|nr:pseudoazurin [uncultured Marivita sp.]
MKLKSFAMAAALSLAPFAALADIIEVKMLNRGEAGAMVFEPRFVSANVGDTVKFIAVDKGHNAETMNGMVPEGQEPFKGKINEEIAVEMTAEGTIGVICKPHLGMGMVMVIQVGDAEIAEDFLDVKMPKRAEAKFEEAIAERPQS